MSRFTSDVSHNSYISFIISPKEEKLERFPRSNISTNVAYLKQSKTTQQVTMKLLTFLSFAFPSFASTSAAATTSALNANGSAASSTVADSLLRGNAVHFPASDDGKTRYYATWKDGQLCSSKSSRSVEQWEESFHSLKECCLEVFGWAYDECMESRQ